jgi:hypothetical protein
MVHDHASVELWERLIRPFNPTDAVGAVLGLEDPAIRRLLAAGLAASPEADALLDHMPNVLRALAVGTDVRSERCVYELRGPVLWGETLGARSARFGDDSLYVCAVAHRSYDNAENRVLVAALRAIIDAGGRLDGDSRPADAGVAEHARLNAARAARFLEHRALTGVLRIQPGVRTLQRTRQGNRRRTYQPALDVLARAQEPLTIDRALRDCDPRTTAQHGLVLGLCDGLARRGLSPSPPRVMHEVVVAGPLTYRHPRRMESQVPHGILLGNLLVDVPDHVGEDDRQRATALLEQRAAGRPVMAVLDEGDVDDAVDYALERGLIAA